MKVLVVKNIPREGPGLLVKLLEKYAIEYDLIEVYNGDTFPDLKKYKAVFVFGGPMSANQRDMKMRQEIILIRNIIANNIPYLGVCLGLQIMMKAIGGKVIKNAVKEIGWKDKQNKYYQIELTQDGKKDYIFRGLSSPLKIFQLHGETVKPPSDCMILANGADCPVQVVKHGTFTYGVQGHFELTEDLFDTWISEDPDLIPLNTSELLTDYRRIKDEYENVGTQIFTNFLHLAYLT